MEEIFQRISLAQGESVDPLEFEKLDQSTIAACLRNSTSDVDFLCVIGRLENLLENGDLRRMVQACNGSFYSRSKIERLRLDKKTIAFGIVDLRPYTIAVVGHSGGTEEVDEEEFDCSVEVPEENVSEKMLYENVNTLLSKLTARNCPFRDIEENLRKYFNSFQLALFSYGQKQPLDDYKTLLMNNSSKVETYVAIGTEFELEDSTILCSSEGTAIGESFYSMFMSKEFGSILVKNPLFAAKLVQKSYRMCVYNTSHHQRKNQSPSLELDSQSSETNLVANVLQTVHDKTLFLERNVVSLIQSSKLRCEAYFKLEAEGR